MADDAPIEKGNFNHRHVYETVNKFVMFTGQSQPGDDIPAPLAQDLGGLVAGALVDLNRMASALEDIARNLDAN